MDENKIREQLVLRPVTIHELEQFDNLLRYVFQVTNDQLWEMGYEDNEITQAKAPILERANVIGWFNGDQLVSQLSVYPCKVNIHGKIFLMGGVTGVGTYPEYSSMGLMNELIKKGLEIMKENKQWISYLYPYSIPYYRRKGWEIISDRISFTIKDNQLPDYKEMHGCGHVERLPVTHPDVISVYDEYSRVNHAALIREEQEWEEYWRWESEDDRIAAVYYDDTNQPKGYILYWISDDIFHIKDFIYIDNRARMGLWNFIHAHYSMIEKVQGRIFKNEPLHFLLDDGYISESVKPYYMARIVDVENFLKEFPFGETDAFVPFYFEITDPVADWNNGIFSVKKDKNNGYTVSREKTGVKVAVTIQTLTALMMSYCPPSYLHEIGRIDTDEKILKVLDQLIPQDKAYFSDYF